MKIVARRMVLGIEIAVAAVVALAVGVGVFLSYLNANDYRKDMIAAVEAATGLKVTINGSLFFTLTPIPTAVATDVRVANPPWSERPHMIRADRVEIGFSPIDLLLGRQRLLRLAMSGAEIELEYDRRGRANWWIGWDENTPATTEPWIPPDIPRMEIARSRLTYRDGVNNLTALIGIQEARLALPLDAPFTLAMTGDWFGTPFRGKLEGGSFADLVNDRALWPVEWSVQGAGATLDGRGTVDRPITIRMLDQSVTMTAQRLSLLEPVLGLWLPEVGPFQGTARLAGAAGVYTLSDLSTRFGESDLAGRLVVYTALPRYRVSGKLAGHVLRRVDLVGADDPDDVPLNDGRLFSARPLPFGSLNAGDGRVDLKVDRFVTWPIDLHQLSTTIDLNDRRLVLEPFHATVAGGRADLKIEADAAKQPPAGRVSGRADGMVMEQLLPALGMTLPPTGPLDLTVDLAGRGDSLRGLLARANGRMRLLMGRGTLPIRNFDLLASDLVRSLIPAALAGDRTELNCTAARISASGGIAHVEGLLIDTARITVTGAGAINLATEQLDLLLNPRPKDPSLISLATPMRLTGTLYDHSASPDAMGLARGAAAGLVLGAINPLAAVLPLISLGTGIANPCMNIAPEIRNAPDPDPAGPVERLKGFLGGITGTPEPGR